MLMFPSLKDTSYSSMQKFTQHQVYNDDAALVAVLCALVVRW